MEARGGMEFARLEFPLRGRKVPRRQFIGGEKTVEIKILLQMLEGCHDPSATIRKGSGPPVGMTGRFCGVCFAKRNFRRVLRSLFGKSED